MSELLASRMSSGDVDLLRALGRLAADRGTRAFVVGGVVRDLFCELPTYDLDVVVEEDAGEFAAAAAELLGGSVKAHTRFGTVIFVTPSGRKVDLATSRSETYERPGALPTVKPGSIEEDLRRRDFTINSMALNLDPDAFGEILDLYGGLDDLNAHVLRVLTDVSFEDDPTRILRGVRFAARFDLSFESGTEELLKRAVAERRTETVSGERLMNEFVLILSENEPWPPVKRLAEWGVLDSICPGWVLPETVRETMSKLAGVAADGAGAGDVADGGRWTSLFLVMLEPVEASKRTEIVDRLSAGRRVRGLARELGAFESEALPVLESEEEPAPSALYRALSGFSPETLLMEAAVRPDTVEAARIGRFRAELADVSTELTGRDLAELGVAEGRAVGEILDAVLDARLDGAVTSVDDERRLARELAQSLTAQSGADSVSDNPGNPGTRAEAPEMKPDETIETAAETEPGTAEQATSDEGASAQVRPVDDREQSMVNRPVYEVKLEAFEGPLDLLLHLIREHEIDIYDIPIATITEQYLEYIGFMDSLDLALAGEFLEMAATLIRIKVQMLLPRETDEEEEEDPREQLVRKLVEYKKFKEAAGALSEKEQDRRTYFPRGVDPKSYADLEEEEMDMADFMRDVTLFDLVDGLREVLSRVPERVDVHAVGMEEVTVEEQIERIRALVVKRESIPFTDVFGESATRFEIVATFIALLELIRLGAVKAVQKRNFGDIEIVARAEE